MGGDVDALRALEADPRFGELNDYVPPLSLVRAFGVARDEVAHSRVLARLLDLRRHRGAGFVLAALLRDMAARPGVDEPLAEKLRTAAEGPFERVAVHRERLLIDVVVEVDSPRGALVVGIENKIDAGEQPEQIARYQAALSRAYPTRTPVMAFLTPTGRGPTTARPDDPVPVVTLGYDVVLRVVGKARGRAASGSRDERALLELEAHIREDILGEAGEAKTLAGELWRTHGRALRLAIRYRPRLEDIREDYVALLSERFEDARFEFYPGKRADLREIKMNLRSWDDRGLPFTFMLYAKEEGRPHVRVLIWRDRYGKRADSLASWARQVNASGEPLIDENFSRLPGWQWHRVLREEAYPLDAALEEDAFDDETVRAAVDAVAALVELLRPHVEGTQPRT